MDEMLRLYEIVMAAVEEEDQSRVLCELDAARDWLVHEPCIVQHIWLAVVSCWIHSETDSVIVAGIHMTTDGDKKVLIMSTLIKGNDFNVREEVVRIGSIIDALSVVPALEPTVTAATVKLMVKREGKEVVRDQHSIDPSNN